MNLKKLLILVCVISLMLVAGCGSSTPNKVAKLTTPHKQTSFLMGTVVTVKIYDENKKDVLDPVFKRIEDLANLISASDTESEIDKVNQYSGKQPVEVSKDVFTLIEAGKNYSEKSNGSFDISIGPLTSLWHIGYPDARMPAQTEIEAILPLISYQQIELNKEAHTVFLKEEKMKLDLGAIAKGFIADEVVSVLKEHQVETAIVDLGGNIYVLGKNVSEKEWTVGIQDPFSARGEIVGKISESNKSIVTSGVYERYLEVDGVKYHHLLNPIDGYPFNNDIAGVSIITDKSIDGDALSTSVFSKGVKAGMEYIENFDGAEAIFVSHDKKIYISSGLKNEFELTNDQFKVMEELPQQ